MKITEKKIKVSELFEGFKDCGEAGIVGYGGRLNIRPAYQREFIYNPKEVAAVISTIDKGFPLNVMYWAKSGENQWEIMDGQQRILSICKYCNAEFSIKIDGKVFFIHNLKQNYPDKYKKLMDYELFIYECDGDKNEILDWFRVIKIEKKKLTDQELRNISYTGTWLTSAKKFFSKTGCPAYEMGKDYIMGSPIRQEYLEKAIQWKIQEEENKTEVKSEEINNYMKKHMNDKDATELWQHFRNVIDWIDKTFTKHRRAMKSVDWNTLYLKNKNKDIDVVNLEKKIKSLVEDEDVQSKSGIYPYLLSNEVNSEKYLNIREFGEKIKREAFERQEGKCKKCRAEFDFENMEGVHITPWSLNRKTISTNCQMLCKDCNRKN